MSVAIIINQYSIKYCKAIHSWKLSIRSLWCTVYVSFTCLKGLSTESNSICQFCFAGNTPLFWNFYTLIVMKLCIALFFKIDAVCNIQRVSSHAMLNVYHCKAKPLTFSLCHSTGCIFLTFHWYVVLIFKEQQRNLRIKSTAELKRFQLSMLGGLILLWKMK